MTVEQKVKNALTASKRILAGMGKNLTSEALEEIEPAYSEKDNQIVSQDEIDKMMEESKTTSKPRAKPRAINNKIQILKSEFDKNKIAQTIPKGSNEQLLSNYKEHIKIIAENNRKLKMRRFKKV